MPLRFFTINISLYICFSRRNPSLRIRPHIFPRHPHAHYAFILRRNGPPRLLRTPLR
jgi:hypothetical protein